MKLLVALFFLFVCAEQVVAAEQSVPIDSKEAVEQAYAVVRAGDALPVATLKETADGLLVKLINAATVAGEFIAEQIPQVLKELLYYNTAYLLTKVLLGVVLLAIGLSLANKYWKYYLALPSNWDGKKMITPLPHIVWATAWIPGALFFMCNISELLKITLAPRVWLIEYAASLVK